jgi:hypothetical protein
VDSDEARLRALRDAQRARNGGGDVKMAVEAQRQRACVLLWRMGLMDVAEGEDCYAGDEEEAAGTPTVVVRTLVLLRLSSSTAQLLRL